MGRLLMSVRSLAKLREAFDDLKLWDWQHEWAAELLRENLMAMHIYHDSRGNFASQRFGRMSCTERGVRKANCVWGWVKTLWWCSYFHASLCSCYRGTFKFFVCDNEHHVKESNEIEYLLYGLHEGMRSFTAQHWEGDITKVGKP